MAGQIFGDFHLSVAPQFVAGYAMIVVAMVAAFVVHQAPKSWTTGLTAVFSSASPEIPDAELREAIHILVTMYAYVISRSITDLEMNGF